MFLQITVYLLTEVIFPLIENFPIMVLKKALDKFIYHYTNINKEKQKKIKK